VPDRPEAGGEGTRAWRPDVPSLVGGLVVIGLGAVLLLDRLDVWGLRFAALAPLACAAIGAVLLASGLSRRE
jgi:hypothetical protein